MYLLLGAWREIRSTLTVLEKENFEVKFKYVPDHVGVYDNERADRLAKTAARRAHLPVSRTEKQREEQMIDAPADSISSGHN